MLNPAFMRAETWLPGASNLEHYETHAAHVFLVGPYAFKMKKPVKLPYLDFSTSAARRDVLQRELAINRAITPEIYDCVIDVLGEPVLRMQRFDNTQLLSVLARHHGVDDALAAALARMAAEAHAEAPAVQHDGAVIMQGLGEQLATAFQTSPDIFPPEQARAFAARYDSERRRVAPLLSQRSAVGWVRRCHGDMHCGNIVVLNGRPRLFDAIEFSEEIATIDILYDLAFLLMDLRERGEKRAANRALNAYLNHRRIADDLPGLAALPLFLATRAGVRALVLADLVHEGGGETVTAKRQQARDYFTLALTWLTPSRGQLLCLGGFSGTGKSTLAASLAPEIGRPPGALHLRTDVERKVLAAVPETARLPDTAYGAAASAATYEAVFARAAPALAAGWSVVLDGVFASPGERERARHLAETSGAVFQALWLEAPLAHLKARVEARTDDASDATPAVVEKQVGSAQPVEWPRLDATGTPAEVLAAARRSLQLQPASPA